MSEINVIEFDSVRFAYGGVDGRDVDASGGVNASNDVNSRDADASGGGDAPGGTSFALSDLALRIPRGQFVCVIGANGSGKSTFARHLNALLVPTEGSVSICGCDTTRPETHALIRPHVGMVFQNPDDQLVASLVEDEVAFGPENLGIEPSELRKRVGAALHATGLDGFEKRDVGTLSGGQKQRVSIAGALAMRPDILVLDEASSMLDPQGRVELMEIAHALHARGMTIVMITHFMDEAAGAERVVVLEGGRVALDGTPDDVLTRVDELAALGLESPLPCRIAHELRAHGVDAPLCLDANALASHLARCREDAGATEGSHEEADAAAGTDADTAHEEARAETGAAMGTSARTACEEATGAWSKYTVSGDLVSRYSPETGGFDQSATQARPKRGDLATFHCKSPEIAHFDHTCQQDKHHQGTNVQSPHAENDHASERQPLIAFENVSFSYDDLPLSKKRRMRAGKDTEASRTAGGSEGRQAGRGARSHKNAQTSGKAGGEASRGNDESCARWALRGINLALLPGEVLGIAGRTGSGKSTLIRHMNGLLHPTRGRVLLDGYDLADKSLAASTRMRVGVAFQYPETQLFASTVYDDVAFGPRNLGIGAAEVGERVREALDQVGLAFEDVARRSPFELSGGQQRRVALAGVLVMRPDVLVLDEPTAGLDPAARAQLHALIGQLRTQDVAVVVVSHSMEGLAHVAERIVVLDDGAIAIDGTTAEVLGGCCDLASHGLRLPAAQALARRLREAGLDLPEALYDEHALIRNILRNFD